MQVYMRCLNRSNLGHMMVEWTCLENLWYHLEKVRQMMTICR
uniref:Uncharacterized protein n=1 Tax=Arundo donax TaxID=35708 RepID=A0A0A8XTY7_ARUDO